SAQLVYHILGTNRRTVAFLRGKMNERGESMLVAESVDLNGWFKHKVFNKPFKPAVNNRDWHTIKVSIRGDQATIFVNGKQVAIDQGLRHPNGRLGLRSSGGFAEFRNIKVTDPAGQVLWEGLPELP
ncbi:MAG: family 16 glycoside hydrolase, partial [Gemmataceae bacterium]